MSTATELGVVVSGTGYFSYPTAELTRALIRAAARKLPQQVQSMRTGGWQLGLGTSVRGLTLGVLGLRLEGRTLHRSRLVDALRRHVISCAAVDVYEIESLPADHSLRSLDNALLTPHIGYVSQRLLSGVAG